MARVLAIDLAARHSAMVLLAEEVVTHAIAYDAGPSPTLWDYNDLARQMAKDARDAIRSTREPCDVLIEDVPPRVINLKPVMILQTCLRLALHDARILEVNLILPSTWQRALGYRRVKGTTTKGWAKEESIRRGLETKVGGKAQVDIRDAFLMACWALEA